MVPEGPGAQRRGEGVTGMEDVGLEKKMKKASVDGRTLLSRLD